MAVETNYIGREMNKFWKIVSGLLFHTLGQIVLVPAFIFGGIWFHSKGFNATFVLVFLGTGILIALIAAFLRIKKDKTNKH